MQISKLSFMSLLVSFLLIQGCNDTAMSQVVTQGQGEVALKADEYSLSIYFSGQGKSTSEAMAALNNALDGFYKWREATSFDVVTQSQSVRPQYVHEANKPRSISGYIAQHGFKVKCMNLEQYDKVLKELALLQPESLNQAEIGVSDDRRSVAQKQAYEMAFVANEAKLQTLMGLSELCDPVVERIQEHSQSHIRPRMMMEAKAAPVANEHTVSVSLDITWRANPC